MRKKIRTIASRESRFLRDFLNQSPKLAMLNRKARQAWASRDYSQHKSLCESMIVHGSVSCGAHEFSEKFSQDFFLGDEESHILNGLPVWVERRYYRYLSLYGDLLSAWRVKSHLRERLIGRLSEGFITLDSMQACIEANEIEVLRQAVTKYRFNGFRKEYHFPKIFEWADLLVASSAENCASESRRNAPFFKGLQNKKIAVVGPAPIAEGDRDFLDSFDYVVFPNFFGGNVVYDSKKKYYAYTGGAAKKSEGVFLEMLPFLDGLSLSSDESVSYFMEKSIGTNCRVRKMYPARHVMLTDYGLNMIQNILYDLFLHGCAKISLFGVTLYASESLYTSGYSYKGGKEWAPSGMRIHDPFSNYSFIKSLHDRGFLSLDSVSEDVMNLGEEGYVNRLVGIYGKQTLDMYEGLEGNASNDISH